MKCEWKKGCRGKATYHGHHWGCRFGLCRKHAKNAKRYYEVCKEGEHEAP